MTLTVAAWFGRVKTAVDRCLPLLTAIAASAAIAAIAAAKGRIGGFVGLRWPIVRVARLMYADSVEFGDSTGFNGIQSPQIELLPPDRTNVPTLDEVNTQVRPRGERVTGLRRKTKV